MELSEVKSFVEGQQQVMLDAIKTYRTELDKKYDAAIEAGAPIAELKTEMERVIKRLDNAEQELKRPSNATTQKARETLGKQFIEHEQFKAWASRSWHKGGTSVHVPTFFPDELKTTITSAAVGSVTSAILVPERMPGIVKPGVRRIRVRDLMPRTQTTQNAVEYVKENAYTNNASPVAETISKQESALTFTIANAPVRTLAHWIPATRQILDDFVQLQGYVDQRLIEGLKDVEDYELVGGDGTGQHLSGLSTQAGAYDTARAVSGDTYIDQLNHALSQIEDALQVADGIVLHPRDWRKINLTKTEEGGANKGMYLMGGPSMATNNGGTADFGTGGNTLWGVPVAVTTAVTRGTFYVGSFQRYAMVHDRMDARIDISTEHADYFIRNMIAIRAEERLTFTVQRNDAVIYGAFV